MKTKNPLRIIFVALVTISASTSIAAPSHAEYLGGKWDQRHYYYHKFLHGYTGYADPADDAATGWTNQTVFSVLNTSSTTSYDTALNVDNYGTTDWFGIGQPGPSVSSGTYSFATIKINATWLNTGHFNCANPGGSACDYPADTASQRRCTISHEIGHTIGLAHSDVSPPLAKSIMAADHGLRCHSWGIVNPQTRDDNAVSTLY